MNHAFLNIDYDKSLAVECLKKKAFTITDENNNDDFMDIAVINDIDFKKYIRSLINLPFPVEVVFLVNPPNSIYYKPHIDLCRQCAINFPVNVYGNVWTAKNQDDIYFKINNIGGKDEVVFPSIDDSKRFFLEQAGCGRLLRKTLRSSWRHSKSTRRSSLHAPRPIYSPCFGFSGNCRKINRGV